MVETWTSICIVEKRPELHNTRSVAENGTPRAGAEI